jgi:hypothetical protein
MHAPEAANPDDLTSVTSSGLNSSILHQSYNDRSHATTHTIIQTQTARERRVSPGQIEM